MAPAPEPESQPVDAAMAEDERAPTLARQAFGRQLRALRLERGLTLQACSRLAGQAISTLSNAERGVMALTYDRLARLATGLGIERSALFGAEGESFRRGSVAVARRGEFLPQETPTYGYELLFPELWGKAMTPMTGVVKANSRLEFDDYIRHAGQEFLFVLSGELTVHIEGRPPLLLRSGESLYFDSVLGHIYTSTGAEEARVLVVCFGESLRRRVELATKITPSGPAAPVRRET